MGTNLRRPANHPVSSTNQSVGNGRSINNEEWKPRSSSDTNLTRSSSWPVRWIMVMVILVCQVWMMSTNKRQVVVSSEKDNRKAHSSHIAEARERGQPATENSEQELPQHAPIMGTGSSFLDHFLPQSQEQLSHRSSNPFSWMEEAISNENTTAWEVGIQFEYHIHKLRGAPLDVSYWKEQRKRQESRYGNANNKLGVNRDNPPFYQPADIQQSIDFLEEHSTLLHPYLEERLQQRKQQAFDDCASQADGFVQASGGWCLEAPPKNTISISNGDYEIPIPLHHVLASNRVTRILGDLIATDHVQSITDFGAGVGQYKYAVQSNFPDLVYNAYDGAGNGANYTHGYLEYIDLTMPLALPKTDWVLSLEVGEHIPNEHEGLFMFNLHAHNCKGVILSWGRLGQRGHAHVNNHSNEYIIAVFDQLGYTLDRDMTTDLRNATDNNPWFRKSAMAFRRRIPVC